MSREKLDYFVYGLANPLKPSKESYIGGPALHEYEFFYFGFTSREERLDEHLACYDSDGNRHKKSTIKKIERNGEEVIFIKILENVDELTAKAEEIEKIAYYGRADKGLGPLTNMTDGGEGVSGYKHTEYTKKLMSENNKGTGRAFKGKKRSQDFCDKISKGTIKRFENPIEREKCRVSAIKRWTLEEKEKESQKKIDFYQTEKGLKTKEKISVATKGIPKGLMRESTKEKIGVKNKKNWENWRERKDIEDPWITYVCGLEDCYNETTIRTSEYNKRLEKYDMRFCNDKSCATKVGWILRKRK